ncbi:biotin--[acetyl-CoA-carboxylase] ligase [Membranihabitans maritimus]|uniref:biotin--[acetyl-CoA-carboxylase] ligase n=1 Tax=Membranihabitans maritimus TaxID=2904244 RepID=UPI001F00703B|nr:biotin--[acetyl-CoA-carboxylase] ligase [Membranihabitans maritimus]
MAEFDHFKHFSSISSTNRYGIELIAKSNPPAFTVISADFQTEGVGQIGSEWVSIPGANLLMSIILYPDFINAKEPFKLHFITSLACTELLRQFIKDERIQIKWPNDILVDRKKIAGLLIKNTFSGNHVKNSVVGIGMNVNQDDFDKYLFNATSLKMVSDKEYNISDLRIDLYGHLKRFYNLAENGKSLKEIYLTYLFGYDEDFSFFDLVDQEYKRGIIVDVLCTGELVVEVEGVERKYDFKQIKFLLNEE